MTEPVVADLLLANTEAGPAKLFAAFDSGERWSYEEALARAWSLAAGLADLGVQPGEPVLTWLPNGPAAILTLLGVNCAGAVYAPLNVAYRGSLLEHAVNLPRAALLIVHAELVHRLAGLTLPHLKTVVVVGEGEVQLPGVRVLGYDQLIAHESLRPGKERQRLATDDMTYIYTSGTTGPSKSVRCSYRHHQAYAEWFHHGDLGAEDRGLVSLPMFHVGGTNWVYNMLLWGGSIAVLPRFQTSSYWDSIRTMGATTTTVMAAMATFLMREPPRPDDADNPLRIGLLVPGIPQAQEFAERFGVELWTGFAMTEVPGPLRTELRATNLKAAGVATSPQWHLRLVDDDGADVTGEEVGEVLVRPDTAGTVTDGYVNMAEATAKVWRDGWFHTGDLFKRDAEGNFYFVDRGKDALRRRGENISSFELEAEIVAHPDVAEAAAVGVPAAEGEDEVMAFVVLREGSTLTARELLDFLIPRMPHYMVPRYFQFIPALPRTPTEKVKKAELRAQGPGVSTWDRESEGIFVKATRLGQA